ncbi:MAG: hypothetical protein R2854_09470 [Caldilineaceae bacterium]
MANSQIFTAALIWIIAWGAVGGIVTPRIYARRDLDVSQATLGGALVGAALGPFGLIPLWIVTPAITNWINGVAAVIVAGILVAAFALAYPENLCVTNPQFMVSQLTNGIVIGLIYSLMALGLTLIYSILGIVSFAHGEFYMIGGMVVYFMSASALFGEASALVWLLGAALVTFLIGAVFEVLFLRPMGEGKIERPKEYAILVTFGLAFFLQYLVQALAGASPVRAHDSLTFRQLPCRVKKTRFFYA